MSNINNRIFEIIEHFGLNKNSFSKKIGLDNNVTVGNIVGGRLNKPSYEIIEKILLTFDSINSDWLVTGNGSMLKNENIELISKFNTNQIICKSCQDKERIIISKEETIDTLKETVSQLKKNLSYYEEPIKNGNKKTA